MRWLKVHRRGKILLGSGRGRQGFCRNRRSLWRMAEDRAVARAEGRQDRVAALCRAPSIASGSNYLKHLKEAADKAGTVPNVPDRPEIGYRAQNALIAHDEDVVIPASATDKIHYEGELAVVIGKKAKHLTEADAMSCVFGYTIGNDVSERTWQKADRGLWRSKNADTFKPMGPWIETDVDLDKMETVIRVNGKETGRFRTNDMIFGIVPFIVELTKYFTLWPGDVIWMGTDGASPDIKARRRGRDRHHRHRHPAQPLRPGRPVGHGSLFGCALFPRRTGRSRGRIHLCQSRHRPCVADRGDGTLEQGGPQASRNDPVPA